MGSAKGRVRLVDPVSRVPSDVTNDEALALGAGEVVLIARRIGGQGFDPTTFGFRWFLPSIWRYRRPLAQVLVASLVPAIVRAGDADPVPAHRRQSAGAQRLFDADGADYRHGVARLLRERAAVPAHLHAEPHHQPHRRRTGPAAVPPPVPAAAVLFRDARRRPDRGARARTGDDPQLPHRPGPHLGARPRVHIGLFRGDVRLFVEADVDRDRLDPDLHRAGGCCFARACAN